MANLQWKIRRNLENSLKEFLTYQASDITVFFQGEQKSLDIRVGESPRDDWSLPVISCYLNSRTANRAYVGNNKRLKFHLMIIDIRALDDGMREDLAEWVSEVINNGFDLYKYMPDPVTPDTVDKTLEAKVSVDFLNDTVVTSGEDVDLSEKYRHRISISCTINKGDN